MSRLFVAPLLLCLAVSARADGPIRPLAENPRYFEFRGKPTILITSGEHYGAVLNRDFDALAYLDALHRDGLNNTRTFAGTYRESPESLQIRDNTLAPKPGRFLAPWTQVRKPGEPEKFDLDRFDAEYFARLKDFLKLADERGVVVELNLFCVLYDDGLWAINPMNTANNVNGVGDCPRQEVLTLKHDNLIARQVAFVKKVVAELNGFDNLYYEICNEPYFGASAEWQALIARTIVEAERDLPKRHMVSQNIANEKASVEHPDPSVSLFNFHYAVPEAVAMNAHLNRPIGDNETGFKGTGDRVYRTQAWQFLLAGGALFNNLDYSFTTAHPDGTAEIKEPTPGGGGEAFRRQMAVLAAALNGCEFWTMKPAPEIVAALEPADARVSVLAGPRDVLAYIDRGPKATLALKLPPGRYTCEWIDPPTGVVRFAPGEVKADGLLNLDAGAFLEDVAVRIRPSKP